MRSKKVTRMIVLALSIAFLAWSGGTTQAQALGNQFASRVVVDGSGNQYVVGTSSAGWGSPVRAYTAGDDAFVAKLNSNGEVVWHTFLGGAGTDRAYGVALDESNNDVYVTGYSNIGWGGGVTSGWRVERFCGEIEQ
jgi:hypothetical protein